MCVQYEKCFYVIYHPRFIAFCWLYHLFVSLWFPLSSFVPFLEQTERREATTKWRRWGDSGWDWRKRRKERARSGGWNEERVNWSLPGEKGKMLGWGREKKKEAMLDWRRTNATSINKRYGSAISAWIWIHNFIRRERTFAEWRKGGMIPAGRLLAWQRLLHFLKLFATGGRKKKIQR